MTRDKTPVVKTASAVAATPANPEGKGQIGFLLDWAYSTPRNVIAKQKPQLLADYFTSLLVLTAAFKFKPAYETDYYLYAENGGWTLSLIAPDEWRLAAKREAFVGRCVLHGDSTWSIDPADNITAEGPVQDALLQFYDGFVNQLDSKETLESLLPVYAGQLPYWQRLFASALSRSVKASLDRGEQRGVAARDWLLLMPSDAGRLLRQHDQDSS